MDTDAAVYAGPCAARALLDRIADKWTALIIGILAQAEDPVRFTELRRAIGGISQKMLTQTLRDLERDGLVVRTVYPVIPPKVDYRLTVLGASLEEPLGALAAWAERHMPEVRRAQESFDGRAAASDGVRRSA